MAQMTLIELGATYRDRITGFRGVATGHCRYISGCSQILLQPSVDGDGKTRGGEWFDEQRLERLDAEVIVLDNSDTPGCDMPAPIR